MKLPIYSTDWARTPKEFVSFWASQWGDKDKEKDKQLYTPYIAGPLTEEGLLKLFEWKNQTPLAQKKRQTVERFISQLAQLQALPKDLEPQTFLNKFQQGGAIWRIFLLHCWSHSAGERKYPIYDQHVHRAMTIIRENRREEIGNWSDDQKIEAYLERYIPFFKRFGCQNSQQVDQSLMIFGRFMKNYRFPTTRAKIRPIPRRRHNPE
jgi:hypothetical protein